MTRESFICAAAGSNQPRFCTTPLCLKPSQQHQRRREWNVTRPQELCHKQQVLFVALDASLRLPRRPVSIVHQVRADCMALIHARLCSAILSFQQRVYRCRLRCDSLVRYGSSGPRARCIRRPVSLRSQSAHTSYIAFCLVHARQKRQPLLRSSALICADS